MLVDLGSCFSSDLEARLARVDSGFAAACLRPHLGSSVFKSFLLQPCCYLSLLLFGHPSWTIAKASCSSLGLFPSLPGPAG